MDKREKKKYGNNRWKNKRKEGIPGNTFLERNLWHCVTSS